MSIAITEYIRGKARKGRSPKPITEDHTRRRDAPIWPEGNPSEGKRATGYTYGATVPLEEGKGTERAEDPPPPNTKKERNVPEHTCTP